MRNALFFFVVLLFAAPAYAQFSIPGAGSAISISTTPVNPGPNTPVTLTVQSALYDVTNADITWTAGGTVIAQGPGATTAKIITGAIGSVTTVQVRVSTDNGIASSQITIVPASVDLLWEANSYTPPFYRGRALSSAGSSITVVALPHLVRPSGSVVASDQITYTWKKDGVTIASVSGRGKSTAVFDGPMLYGTASISVVATAADGSVTATSLLRVGDTATQLALYEDTPLFGILYHKALTGTTYIPETEMSFAVSPYFAPVFTPADSQLEYDWTVNGNPVSVDTVKPYEITINAEKSSGIATIALQLGHATNFFFDAHNSWNVTFSNSTNGTSAGTFDSFHQ